jgi:hypothetical protein
VHAVIGVFHFFLFEEYCIIGTQIEKESDASCTKNKDIHECRFFTYYMEIETVANILAVKFFFLLLKGLSGVKLSHHDLIVLILAI